jgi:hypothetical protein
MEDSEEDLDPRFEDGYWNKHGDDVALSDDAEQKKLP